MAQIAGNVGERWKEKNTILTCPYCNNEMNNFAIGNTVKFFCEKCQLNGYLTRLPKGVPIQDFQSRKTIA